MISSVNKEITLINKAKMTDKELLKLIEDCCNDIFDRLEPLANVKSRLYESLKPAINYTRCCEKLQAIEDLKDFDYNNCQLNNTDKLDEIIERL